jgi:hypothetical protein
MAHTPGPWKVAKRQIKDGFDFDVHDAAGNELICIYDNDGADDPTWFPVEANANLIAAAPELLEVARRFIKFYGGCDDGCECTGDLAQRAIAKAEGR